MTSSNEVLIISTEIEYRLIYPISRPSSNYPWRQRW